MGTQTGIAWTDHTFNPWRGCTKVSAGCTHCYAETLSKRNPSVLGTWGKDGLRPVAAESYWKLPLTWDRVAAATGVRRRVFCASLADVFEDRDDLLLPRARLMQCIRDTPHLDWLLLTKRPENIVRLLRTIPVRDDAASANVYDALWIGDDGLAWQRHFPNVWLGTTVEHQQAADARLPIMLAIPAAQHFISAEPLVGPVSLMQTAAGEPGLVMQSTGVLARWTDVLSWVIIGGESGAGARPMHPTWVRNLMQETQNAGIATFFKQWGAYQPVRGTPPQVTFTFADGAQVGLYGARMDTGLWDNQRVHALPCAYIPAEPSKPSSGTKDT